MELSVCFLDKRDPELFRTGALAEDELLVALVSWQTVVNNHVSPERVLEETQHIQVHVPVFMENGRVDSHRENHGGF